MASLQCNITKWKMLAECLLLVTILFREIYLSKYYLFASNIHEKDLSFNERDLLQSWLFGLAIALPLSFAFRKFVSTKCFRESFRGGAQHPKTHMAF